MDNLDSLSNEELHVRLLEMGFPNMPVTTTTRKVLIKKLRKHIDGELTKTRRETISAIKHSSDEESDADNRKTNTTDRRTTIGGVPTVAKMMKPPSQPRRSGRITPIGKPEISSAIAPSVPDIIEDTDEDDVIIVEDRRSKSKTPTGFGRRELSSVSIKPVIINEIDSKINENIHEAYQPRTKTTTQYESNFMRNSSSKQPDIGVTKRYTLGSSSTVTSPYGSGSFYSSVTSPYGIGNTTSSVTSPYGIGSTTSTVTSPYGSGNTAGYGAPMATSTFARPSLTTSYNSYDIRSSYNYGNSNLKRHEEKSSEEEYDEEDEFDNDENITPIETPYLSDFTRRLSALKPEPLLQPKHTQSTTTYRNTVYHRSGINTEKKQTKSILDDFKIFYNALNDSYSINRVIIMLSIILFIIFVFVFMFL